MDMSPLRKERVVAHCWLVLLTPERWLFVGIGCRSKGKTRRKFDAFIHRGEWGWLAAVGLAWPGPRWRRLGPLQPAFLHLDMAGPTETSSFFSPYTFRTINQPVLTLFTRRRSNYVLENPGSASSIFSFGTSIRSLDGADAGGRVPRHSLNHERDMMHWEACSWLPPGRLSPFSRPYDLTRHEDTIHNARKQRVGAICAIACAKCLKLLVVKWPVRDRISRSGCVSRSETLSLVRYPLIEELASQHRGQAA